MRSEVLGLVHDEEDVAEAAAADIGQRVDYQFLATEHILDLGDFLTGGREAALDDVQVVEQGQHVRAYLVVHRAGQEAEFLVLERDDGAGEEYLPVVAGLRKGSGQGYEGLSGTGPACEGYQLDVRIQSS